MKNSHCYRNMTLKYFEKKFRKHVIKVTNSKKKKFRHIWTSKQEHLTALFKYPPMSREKCWWDLFPGLPEPTKRLAPRTWKTPTARKPFGKFKDLHVTQFQNIKHLVSISRRIEVCGSKNVIPIITMTERLKNLLESWKMLTKDKQILSFVEGLKIPFP